MIFAFRLFEMSNSRLFLQCFKTFDLLGVLHRSFAQGREPAFEDATNGSMILGPSPRPYQPPLVSNRAEPKPYTLNPNSRIQGSSAASGGHAEDTLNTKPKTLNPKPQTENPKP